MQKSRRPIVVGGSLSGLLAARVLSAAYDEVLIFDRDQIPSSIGPRRGVPQGRHVHGLLARGAVALDETWRRYDIADGRPAGFLVVGDAPCSFNPYAQGNTVAVLEALVLRDLLSASIENLSARHFAEVGRPGRRRARLRDRALATPGRLGSGRRHHVRGGAPDGIRL